MLPAIAEIIEIAERLRAGFFEYRTERCFSGIKEDFFPVGIWNSPAYISDAKLIEMAACPSQRRLQRHMQTIEPDRERHLNAAQNFGLDMIEHDSQANNRKFFHTKTLHGSLALPSSKAEAGNKVSHPPSSETHSQTAWPMRAPIAAVAAMANAPQKAQIKKP